MNWGHIWIRTGMTDGSPIHRDPLPHFMLFPKNDLDIFSDARFTLMDISNYFTPYALFSFPIMRQNKLISDMVDGKTCSGTSWIPSLLESEVMMVLH